MRGVMLEVPEELLERRRLIGVDRYDEMWDGVLHMGPPPRITHQRFEKQLVLWLDAHWARQSSGEVLHDVGVARPGGWPRDYRVPDISLIAPDRLDRLRETHIEGGPTVAVEIRSPGDETYEKFGFYAAIGTAEVWVLHRDTNVPELYVLEAGEFAPVAADAAGWFRGPVSGVWFRSQSSGRVAVRLADHETTLTVLPVD